MIHGLAALLLEHWDDCPAHRDEAIATHLEGLRPASVDRDDLLAQLDGITSAVGERDQAGDVPAERRGPTLSEREGEVLALLAQGLTNRSIADRLFLSPETIKTYVSRVYAKIGVENRTGAAVWALHHCSRHGAGAPPTRPPRPGGGQSSGATGR